MSTNDPYRPTSSKRIVYLVGGAPLLCLGLWFVADGLDGFKPGAVFALVGGILVLSAIRGTRI